MSLSIVRNIASSSSGLLSALVGRWLELRLVFKALTAGVGAILLLGVLLSPWIFVYATEYQIYDEPALKPNPAYVTANGSQAVAMLATLANQAVNEGAWAPSRLWYHPLAHSSNMKNYQLGEQYAISRLASEFTEQLAKELGSGDLDRDLIKARSNLSLDPSSWSLLTNNNAVSNYNLGIKNLLAYNTRLGRGDARLTKISVALSGFLAQVNGDLQSQSTIIDYTVMEPGDFTEAQKAHMNDSDRARLSENGGYFDPRASEISYSSKGRLYVYYIVLGAVGEDFRDMIAPKHVEGQWDDLMGALRVAATYTKYFPANGSRGDFAVPNDLVWQGYLLGRADKLLNSLVIAIRS